MNESVGVKYICGILIAILLLNPAVIMAQDACIAANQQAARDVDKTTWTILGCLSPVIAYLVAVSVKPAPPATALLGKSPEYVAMYTDCYSREAQGRKVSGVKTGCYINVAFIAAYVVLVIAAVESTTNDF